MGRISIALIGLLATVALGQSALEVYTARDGSIALTDPQDVVTAGLPALTGHPSECLRTNAQADGFEYGECGGGSGTDLPDASAAGQYLSSTDTSGGVVWKNVPNELPAYSATQEAFLRAQQTSRTWTVGHLTPRYTTTNTNDCLRVNQAGSGISWRDCPAGGSGTTLPNASAAGQLLSATNTTGGVAWMNAPIGLPAINNMGNFSLELNDGGLSWQPLSVHFAEEAYASLANARTPTPSEVVIIDSVDTTNDPNRVQFVGHPTAQVVLAGLPSLTGHAGNVLTVNSGASGIEWASAGGGGTGGGGSDPRYEEVFKFPDTANSATSRVLQMSAGNCTSLKATPTGTPILLIGAEAVNSPEYIYTGVMPPVPESGNTPNVTYFVGYNNYDFDGSTPKLTHIFLSVYSTRCTFTYLPYPASTLSTQFTNPFAAIDRLSFRILKGGGGGGGGGDTPSIPAPTPAGALEHLRVNAAGAAYELAAPPVARTPSDDTPALVAETGSPGTSEEYSRSDHVHAGGTVALRQIDSADVRTGQTQYGYWLPASGTTRLAGGNGEPYHPWPVYTNDTNYGRFGYSPTRPGLLLDGDNGELNANGIDFTNVNAGTTVRTIKLIVQVTPDNSRGYSNTDGIQVKLFGRGRATDDGSAKEIASVTVHLHSGTIGPIYFPFNVTYSDVPRGGSQDALWFGISQVGQGRQIALTGSGSRLRVTLPHLGPRPTQEFTYAALTGPQSALATLNYIPDGVPASGVQMVGMNVGGSDNCGANAPAETLRADVTCNAISIGNGGTHVYVPVAVQDLSTLSLTATLPADSSAIDSGHRAYLVTRYVAHGVTEIPPTILANVTLADGRRSFEWTGHGVKQFQEFWLLVSSTGQNWGLTWDADLTGTQREYVIVPGLIAERRFPYDGAPMASQFTLPGICPRLPKLQAIRMHWASGVVLPVGPLDRVTPADKIMISTGTEILNNDGKYLEFACAANGADATMSIREFANDQLGQLPISAIEVDYIAGR